MPPNAPNEELADMLDYTKLDFSVRLFSKKFEVEFTC